MIATSTWWALRLALAIEATLLGQLDLDTYGGDYARRRQTQVIILRRVAAAIIIMLAIGAVLLTFDEARSLGTSLLASAGILSLVAGVAAQSTLGNIVAGIQIAVAEPIKLDDVVLIEGEWGNIEEISLTYVIVRIWDRRRLVLPTSYFINNPVTNWTRGGTDISGTVFWYLDHRTPMEAMREEFLRRVARPSAVGPQGGVAAGHRRARGRHRGPCDDHGRRRLAAVGPAQLAARGHARVAGGPPPRGPAGSAAARGRPDAGGPASGRSPLHPAPPPRGPADGDEDEDPRSRTAELPPVTDAWRRDPRGP